MFLCKENNQIVSKIFVPIDRKIGKREHHIEISFKSQCSVQIWSLNYTRMRKIILPRLIKSTDK